MTALPVLPLRDLPLPRLLGRACAAEWTRLRTVRTTWAFLAAAALVMIGIGAIAGNDAAGDADGDPAWAAALIPLLPGQFALLALALTAVTADYATGGIVPALQWTPRRTVLFAARTLVAVGTATLAGLVFASIAAVTAFLTARSALTLPADEGLEALGTVALVVATGATLAAGLGFLLRGTAAALISVFLLMLVLPVILGNLGYDWTTAIAERLPGSGAAFLLAGDAQGMSTTSAVLTLLAWAGGALFLGLLRLVRDDANR